MKVLSRMNSNLKLFHGLPIIRQWIWLVFTPIIPMLNSSNKVSVLSSVLKRKVLFFLRGSLQVSTRPAWKQLLAWKHGFGSHVRSEDLTVHPCSILYPLFSEILIPLSAILLLWNSGGNGLYLRHISRLNMKKLWQFQKEFCYPT